MIPLLLILALQGYAPNCPVHVTGRVIFPAYETPFTHISLEAHKLDYPYGEREAYSGVDDFFDFGNGESGKTYEIVAHPEGMAEVRQTFFAPNRGRPPCGPPDPGIFVNIVLHPGSRPPALNEDAVSIDSLRAGAKDYDTELAQGLQYQKDNKPDDAIKTMIHALELNSASMFARTTLGDYSFQAARFEEAAGLLSQAARLGSTSSDVYYMLGVSLYKLGQLVPAEAALRRALVINPTYGNAHLQLFNVYMKGNLREPALKEAQIYLDQNPDATDHDYVRSMIEKYGKDAPGTVPSRPATPNIAPELAAVLQRATNYVTKYEAALGNLIGTEEYVQTATWPNIMIRMNPRQMAPKAVTRRTSSDFMLIQVGSQWVALREVNSINGAKVKAEEPPLDTAFNGSPEANSRLFNSLKADSAKYNIGDVLRESNLPTFALQVLRQNQVGRFAFDRAGNEKIDGVAVWRIKFREVAVPTLIDARGGEALYSTGTLWVDPVSGQVLKTEFQVANRFAKPVISSSVVVSYVRDKARDILVPSVMSEHYETSENVIDCRAEYTRFHPYTVEIKFDIAPPKP